MLKYVSLMVKAYCRATGKSEEEALKDLAIDDFLASDDLSEITCQETLATLQTDLSGISAWVSAARNSDS